MTSNRPYLIRALYEWIVDNQLTPHLLVNAQHPHVQVPQRFVQEGKIVLNVSPGAVRSLLMGNEEIVFGARFGGVAMEVHIPPAAVLGIYAKENGQGMLFTEEDTESAPIPPDEPPAPKSGGKKPKLTLVK